MSATLSPELDLLPLELGMQELEPMDAPGFWSGFKIGVTISVGTALFGSAVFGATVAAAVGSVVIST
ncbi:daptide-type RiPP [Nonomuraea sp. CA-141351]|uniref:daptide-type RiPP n=1 Tax=Nonomuraea sp. CA-141351 TaxID=3239996 RepID=UPI003D90F444